MAPASRLGRGPHCSSKSRLIMFLRRGGQCQSAVFRLSPDNLEARPAGDHGEAAQQRPALDHRRVWSGAVACHRIRDPQHPSHLPMAKPVAYMTAQARTTFPRLWDDRSGRPGLFPSGEELHAHDMRPYPSRHQLWNHRLGSRHTGRGVGFWHAHARHRRGGGASVTTATL